MSEIYTHVTVKEIISIMSSENGQCPECGADLKSYIDKDNDDNVVLYCPDCPYVSV